jgi:hypothetical protein
VSDLTVAVPAYFHPAVSAADWAVLAKPGQPVRAIVLNIADGPGTAPDVQLLAAAEGAAAAGISVLGYVDTAYGTRPREDVLADLERYRRWYPVVGFFFDQAATSPALLPWYEAVTVPARRRGEVVVLNHGVYPDSRYAEVADALVTFEGPWAAYAALAAPRWVWQWAPERFWHLVYDTPAPLLDAALRRAAGCNAGTVYITDGNGANPWDGLPSYFGDQLAAVKD